MTCKDCIHCEACERMISDTSKMFKALLSEILKMNCDIKYDSTNILSGAEICQCFQDRSRFVELPLKVGDTFYGFNYDEGTISKHMVDEIRIISDVEGDNIVFYGKYGIFTLNEIGSVAFFTKEEAEQALKERGENEK